MIANFYLTFNQWSTRLWVPIFLVASLLAVPMSASAKSIFIALSVGFIIFTPSYRQDLRAMLSQPWCQAAIAFFVIALIGCFWSTADYNERLLVLEKYSKLLYLPILAIGFRDQRTRHLALHAFILAMFITCMLSLLKFTGMIEYNGLDAGRVFRNHIMTGYMMSLAAYLSALLFIRVPGKMRIIYGMTTLLFSFQILFVNTSRTGYVIFLLLLVLLLLQTLSWRHALIGTLAACVIFTLSYSYNSTIQTKIDLAINEWHHFQDNGDKDTSVGYRLQFHNYAQNLFYRHPLIGNGTGSFTYLYRIEKPVPSWDRRLLEPHSQYWLVAAEFGLLGITALIFFFTSLIIASLQLQRMKFVAIAVLLPFLVGNLSDSLLFYSGTGYCFLLFMALCLGERIEYKNSLNLSSD